MEILEEDYYFYKAWREENTGECFLEVTCGTTAVFEIKIKLTGREIADFRKSPESLRILAYKILDSPDSFQHRRV